LTLLPFSRNRTRTRFTQICGILPKNEPVSGSLLRYGV
jgi:hypothetical protein